MDLTLVLMQQLIRVTYFAWTINDMLVPEENLPESCRGRILKDKVTLLDYLAYCFNFLGMLCPSPDFVDYMDFIHERGNYAEIPFIKSEHLRVLRNAGCAAAFYLICSMFLYKPHDVIQPWCADRVGRKFYLRTSLLDLSCTISQQLL